MTRRGWQIVAWAATVAVLGAVPAAAQTGTVINPTLVEFQVSPDHLVTVPAGCGPVDGSTCVAVVDRYELRIFAEGATAPQSVYNLGKPPAAASDSVVQVGIQDAIVAVPVDPSTRFFVRVAAIGSTGEGVSDPSASFFTRVALPSPARAVRLLRPAL